MALPSALLSLSQSLLLLLLPLLPPPLLAKQLTGTARTHRTSQRSPARPSPTDSCGPQEYWSPGHCCLLCPAGEHVREPCSHPHTRGQCDKCDPGTFTRLPNGLESCLLCGTCREDQDEVAECTATSNTRCQCRQGRFYKAPGDEEFCTRCSTCPEGTVVLQQCNSTADTVCGPPGPEGRHRLWLVGSFVIFSAVLGITIVTARTKKPKDGGFQPVCSGPPSSACSELESLEESE
ncbi:tumor necrosis factor receptor superfamily member 23-like [Phyllostomus discolor]|uniref:Tumor necrosis factor receptor superfamily member 23-like n=1 Tax=Phyllostomus discolor TaxID=89673 RepID=A0A7E6E4J6_9CHIR|nr:tumor necrosis factor receptor superfamily member 23-like [Phyllostomus discolor]